jgi:hypothetical protein
MKLGVAIVVLFVGFDGDEEAGRMGGDIIVDGLLDEEPLPWSAEGKVELSPGGSRVRFGATRCDEI